jgi:hypothetical protein
MLKPKRMAESVDLRDISWGIGEIWIYYARNGDAFGKSIAIFNRIVDDSIALEVASIGRSAPQ